MENHMKMTNLNAKLFGNESDLLMLSGYHSALKHLKTIEKKDLMPCDRHKCTIKVDNTK